MYLGFWVFMVFRISISRDAHGMISFIVVVSPIWKMEQTTTIAAISTKSR